MRLVITKLLCFQCETQYELRAKRLVGEHVYYEHLLELCTVGLRAKTEVLC
jgi:hypothetical protein